MKRLIAAVMTLILLPSLICAAADAFSLSYTPKSANSAVFYLDVCCEREMSAAVFEVSFDESMVTYASASACHSASSVRDRVQNGKVSVAFADSGAVTGALCRLSFKALQTGTTTFTLHIAQSADADLVKQTEWEDYTLNVKLGKDDAAVSGSTKSGKSASSSAASSVKKSGEKSYLENHEEDDSPYPPDVVDLRDNRNPMKWMLIGAGILVLIAALISTGVIIGRKTKGSKKEEKPGEAIPEPEEKEEKPGEAFSEPDEKDET